MSEKNKELKKKQQRGPSGGGGPFGGGMPMQKANDFAGTMKLLVAYLKPFRISMLVVFLFAIASTVFSVVGPDIMGKATTKLFEGLMAIIQGKPGAKIDFDYIGSILLTMAILYVVSSLFSYVMMYIMSGVSMKVAYNMRKSILDKMNRLPIKYFDKQPYGEVLSRITNDVDTINITLNQSLSQMITSTVTLIGFLVMMFRISWAMTLVALVVLPLSGILASIFVKKSQVHFKEQQANLGHVNGHVEEIYGAHVVIKAFNGEEKSQEEFDKANGALYQSAWKSQFISGMIMPIMQFVSNIGYVGVSILGGYLVTQGTIKVGDIQAFIQYMRQFTYPISQVAQIATVLQSTAAAAERVFEFLSEEEEVPETSHPVVLEKVEGHVKFDHVRFGYDEDKIVINDFSADIKPGQKVAIVGPTGAGKTTIVKLLMRFYDVFSGEIQIDGHNVKDFRRGDLRSMLGMVLQDTWLFNGSIMENLRYGRLNATDEEVIEAAKAAHAHHFVHTLPDGYNMVLNEEASNVSQGQKQLLTIARTILSDPPVLILDEATSSVDTRTEILIQEAMENLMKGRTSFIIAHRLSTIRNADLILVMDKGDIVEQGTHEELLAAGGFYEKLYNSQFEEGEEEAS